MKKLIIEILDNPDYSMVVPNMIYNRPDLQRNNDEHHLIHARKNEDDYYIPFKLTIDDKGKSCAELGVWLSMIPEEILLACAKHIFVKYKGISRVRYKNCLDKAGYWHSGNHYSIDLPHTSDELSQRLSSKGRSTIKRKKRILKEHYSDYTIEEYTSENIPYEIMREYFRFKEETFGTDYEMSYIDYLSKYHVTNIYVLYFNSKPHAIIMSCEQLPIVYFENTTYDKEYASYSPGQILYDEYLGLLIDKGKETLYLGGGNRDYKKHYGSKEEKTYTGVIYKNSLIRKASEVYGAIKRIK